MRQRERRERRRETTSRGIWTNQTKVEIDYESKTKREKEKIGIYREAERLDTEIGKRQTDR